LSDSKDGYFSHTDLHHILTDMTLKNYQQL
jgi:hypothetical protein